jgi:hypothetical protein
MKRLSPEPIAAALIDLYRGQAQLAAAFDNLWPFTLDGKLIGDIGEAIAMKAFGLSPLRCGQKLHDFTAPDGRQVQVKATQKGKPSKGVGLGLTKVTFEHLIVIEFDRDGYYEVLFNGPGSHIAKAQMHRATVSLSRKQLRQLQLSVLEHEKLQHAP